MVTRLIIFALLLLGNALQGFGQSYEGWAGMVNAGYIHTPSLSSSLNAVYGDSIHFQKGYSIIGGEFNYREGRSIVAVSGYLGFQEGKLLTNKVIESFFWKFHTGFGWMLFRSRSFFVYPVIAAGATGSSASWFSLNRREIERLKGMAPSADVSINADYLLNELLFSIRAGYNRSLSSSIWHNNSGEEVGALTPHQLQGWYVTISFGGLACLKNNKVKKI